MKKNVELGPYSNAPNISVDISTDGAANIEVRIGRECSSKVIRTRLHVLVVDGTQRVGAVWIVFAGVEQTALDGIRYDGRQR